MTTTLIHTLLTIHTVGGLILTYYATRSIRWPKLDIYAKISVIFTMLTIGQYMMISMLIGILIKKLTRKDQTL